MRSVADYVALMWVFMLIMGLIVSALSRGGDKEWATERSPNTGVCYEMYIEMISPIMATRAMSPVDDAYCDERSVSDEY